MVIDIVVYHAVCTRGPGGGSGSTGCNRQDGFEIDPPSRAYCPHEWIGSGGYVGINLAKHQSNTWVNDSVVARERAGRPCSLGWLRRNGFMHEMGIAGGAASLRFRER